MIGRDGPDPALFSHLDRMTQTQQAGPALASDATVMSSPAHPIPSAPASALWSLQSTQEHPSKGISSAAGTASASLGTLFQHALEKVGDGNLRESNASPLPATMSPQTPQAPSDLTMPESDARPTPVPQLPGLPDVASVQGQVTKAETHIMLEHDDLSSRPQQTPSTPNTGGKAHLLHTQTTPGDSPSLEAKAAPKQSPRQLHEAPETPVETNSETTSVPEDRPPSDHPARVEKSRHPTPKDSPAAAGTQATAVIPQATADGMMTSAVPLTVTGPNIPLHAALSPAGELKAAPAPASDAKPHAQPASVHLDTPEPIEQAARQMVGSGAQPAGSGRQHAHSGALPAPQSERETARIGTTMSTRETTPLPPASSQPDKAGFHLLSMTSHGSTGTTDSPLVPPQSDPAVLMSGTGSLPAAPRTSSTATTADTNPTATAQLLPAVIAFASRADGSSQMTLSLHPNDLGEVEIHLVRSNDGSTTVTVVASEAQTLQELSQNAHHLHAALDAANLSAENRTLNFVATLDPGPVPHNHTGAKSDDAGAFQDPGRGGSSGERGQSFQQRQSSHGARIASDDNTIYGAAPMLPNRQSWRMSGLNITA